jgi:hypothetical protein
MRHNPLAEDGETKKDAGPGCVSADASKKFNSIEASTSATPIRIA